jgi:hypothetical protein
MAPTDFVYWLQGVFEVTNPKALNTQQVLIIKQHLALVLKNETNAELHKPLTQDRLADLLRGRMPKSDPNTALLC